MYKIHVDVKKQCLNIVFEGSMRPDEVMDAVNYAISLMHKLMPGFETIYDISRLSLMPPGSGMQLKLLRESITNLKARLLVRICDSYIYEVPGCMNQDKAQCSYETLEVQFLAVEKQILKNQVSNN